MKTRSTSGPSRSLLPRWVGGPGRVVLGFRRAFATWYTNRRLLTKMMAVVIVMSAVSIVVAGVAITGLAAVNAKAQSIYSQGLAEVRQIATMRTTATATSNDMLLAAAAPNEFSMNEYLVKVNSDDSEFADAAVVLKPLAGARHSRELAQVRADYAAYVDVRQQLLLPTIKAQNNALFRIRLRSIAAPLFDKLQSDLEELRLAVEADAGSQANAARSTYERAKNLLGWVLLIALVAGTALAVVIARALVVRLNRVKQVLESLALGDLTQESGAGGRDEIGQMASALDIATANMRGTVAALAGGAATVTLAAEELSAINSQISATAEETAAQAQAVSSAIEQVSVSVQTVASSAEELSASIQEIARNAAEAATVGGAAVAQATLTNAAISELGARSDEIGQVVRLISGIASRTKLLALNATIEAASAGEHGRGFAVVAGEVKELATRTSGATQEAERWVGAVQDGTTKAVADIATITGVLVRINEFQTTIASAVEEQTATTNEVGRSVSQAAVGSAEIARNIAGVAAAAVSTTQGIAVSHQAAARLSELAVDLQAMVSRFSA